jgi:hypothetical protein
MESPDEISWINESIKYSIVGLGPTHNPYIRDKSQDLLKVENILPSRSFEGLDRPDKVLAVQEPIAEPDVFKTNYFILQDTVIRDDVYGPVGLSFK